MTASRRRVLLGIDIGGTKIAAVSVDCRGNLIDEAVASTPALDGPVAVLDVAASLAARLQGGVEVVGVGVATPGVVDRVRGTVLSATGVLSDWAGTNVVAELHSRLHLPIAIDNDVMTAGLGEARLGAGRASRSMLFVALGTGVGGALVLDGQAWHGASGVAGHLGHIAVAGAGDRVCSCGRTGHLEAAVAGPALVRRAAELGVRVDDARALIELANRADGAATSVVREAADVLGRALGGLVNALDVEIVVVGGGVAQAGVVFWEPLEAALRAEVLPPATPAFRRSELGALAGALGATCLVADLAGQASERVTP
jgi:glucokinase